MMDERQQEGEDILRLYSSGNEAAPPIGQAPLPEAAPPLSDDALLQAYTTPATGSAGAGPDTRGAVEKLTGVGGPRYQLWPERAVRSIAGSANALMEASKRPDFVETYNPGDALNVAAATLGGGASANMFRLQRAHAGTAGGGLFAPTTDAATNALATKAGQLGIDLKPSQLGGPDTFVAKLDQMTGQMPLSGRRGETSAQRDQFTQAVSKTFGEDAPQITRETMQKAYKRIGNVMNEVEGRTTVPVGADHQLMSSLGDIASKVEAIYTKDSPQYKAVVSHIGDIFTRAAPYGDKLPGEVFKSLVQKGSALDELAASKEPIGRFGTMIKAALRDAMGRAASPEDAAAYTKARFQYKNAKTIEPLVIKGVPGEVNPLTLQNRVAQQFGVHDAGDLGALADVGQKFMRQPRDSGTPIGHRILETLTHPVNMLAEMTAALGAGHYLGFDPAQLALLGAGGAGGLGASALLSRGIHRMLSSPGNKLVHGAIPYVPAGGAVAGQQNALTYNPGP